MPMYYIGNFQYVADRQNRSENDRRYGDFSMVAKAESSEDALQLFRRKLVSFREKLNYKHDPADAEEETLRQVFNRLISFLFEINQDDAFRGTYSLVGSHGGVLKTLLMAHAVIHHKTILDYHRFEVPNGSILALDVDKHEFKIVFVEGFKFRN